MLTLFTTPVTYLYIDKLRWRARRAVVSPAAGVRPARQP